MSDVRLTLGDLDTLAPASFDGTEVMEAFKASEGQSYKTPIVATAAANTWTGDQTFEGANTFSGTNTFTGQLPNFTGMIAAFAAATPPTGWLAANGSAVSRTTYAALFAAIGTTWGAGDSSTTFNLPDLREVALVGIGTRGEGAAADVYTLGQFKDDQMQGHWHNLNAQVRGNTSGTSNQYTTPTAGGQFCNAESINGSPVLQAEEAATQSGSGNPRTGTTTRGKRVGVQYCIKF